MKKQYIAFLLALLTAGSCITACGGDSSDTQDPAQTETTTETTAETEDNTPKLNLPATDYGGQTFTVLATVHAAYEYDAPELTGEIVSDAVFHRNIAVEEQLGIDLEFIFQPGHWADKDSFNATIKNSVMASDAAHDLVSGTMVCVIPVAAEGIFLNALELEHIQFDNPWWVQGQKEHFAVNNKLFGFVGDASLSLYKDMNVIFFNQKLITDYSLEDPYTLVLDGTWTIDKLIEMSSSVSNDLDGNGKLELGTDLIGYYGHGVPHRGLQTALEYQIIEYDAQDMPSIVPLRDQDASLFFKLLDFTALDNVILKDITDHQEFAIPFTSDLTLFMCEFVYATEYMRDMESDYGIVPQPKRDEAQEEYHTQVGTSTSTFFIPITATDAAMTSMTCEALCYYSWLDVVPAYYEIALKEKYARNTAMQEMLNIIRDSANVNFAFAYSTMFNPFINTLLPGGHNAKDIASYYAANMKSWEATLESLITAYEKIE